MHEFMEVEINDIQIFILNLDHIGMGPREEYLPVLEAAKKVLAAKPPNSVRSLTRINGYLLTDQLKTDIKAFIKHNQTYVKKGAVTGIDGLTQSALNTYNRILRRNIRIFPTEQEALDWLLRD